jgi:hypothetical protein
MDEASADDGREPRGVRWARRLVSRRRRTRTDAWAWAYRSVFDPAAEEDSAGTGTDAAGTTDPAERADP